MRGQKKQTRLVKLFKKLGTVIGAGDIPVLQTTKDEFTHFLNNYFSLINGNCKQPFSELNPDFAVEIVVSGKKAIKTGV